MKKSVVYLFVCMCFPFTSCEYQLGENFVEMEKPPVNSVLTDIYLNIPTDYEGRLYVDETWLTAYTIYPLPGYEVEKCIFQIGETVWESPETYGQFLLDVSTIPNGTYELTCEVFVRTNSGTVAGQLGTEHYTEIRNWPLKVEARDETGLPLPNRINEEGYLELSWDIDETLRSKFDHYTIEYKIPYYTYVSRSSNFDLRTFVSKSYVGAGCIYSVYVYFKDESIRPYSLGKAVLNPIDPQLKAEYPVPGKVRLSWNNPYRSLVNVVYRGKTVAEKIADGTVEFSISGEETQDQSVELRFYPADGTITSMSSFSYMFNLANNPER